MPYNYEQEDVDDFLKDTHGIVEANSFEQLCLWRDYVGWTTPRYDRSKWIENLSGLFLHIGNLGDMPVTLSLFSAIINGKKIVFWDSPSQVVDHRLIEQWFETNLPKCAFRKDNDSLPNRADAMNFHNIFRD